METTYWPIVAGFLLDIIFGDPQWLPHPVRGIGRLISGGEKLARKKSACKTENSAYFHGMILALAVAVDCLYTSLCRSLSGEKLLLRSWVLFWKTVMCYKFWLLKILKRKVLKVYTALQKNDLQGARRLCRIVGRDTQSLNPEQIGKATVETVAENLSDGCIIAPLFLPVHWWGPLGFLYKAINTLDSMVGYKNGKISLFRQVCRQTSTIGQLYPGPLSAYLMLLAVWALPFWILRAPGKPTAGQA